MSTGGNLEQFWSLAPNNLMAQLGADPGGLTTTDAKRRLIRSGPNRLHPHRHTDVLTLLLAIQKSADSDALGRMLSFFLREPVDASIIIAIVLFGGALFLPDSKHAA
jgi:hypothetical protein